MTGKVVLSRRRQRQTQRRGLEQFIGADVEVRCSTGGLVRGHLLAVTPEALVLERHCGRLALVMRAAVSMLLDEQRSTAGEA